MSEFIECEICLKTKTCDEFNPNKKEGGYYPNCKLCNTQRSAEFWVDKKFKECITCGVMLPIRKYEKQDGVPFAACTKCYETRVAEKAAERKRLAAIKKAPTNASTKSKFVPKSTPLPDVRRNVQQMDGTDKTSTSQPPKKAKF